MLSYRRDIETKGLWGNREKVRKHAVNIRKGIRTLKNSSIGHDNTELL